MHIRILRTAVVTLLLLATSVAGADALSDILDKRVIRFGVAEFVPWTMKNESGELIGFEIDVAKKIAADIGVRAEFEVYDWNAIVPALQQGRIDVIAGGMAITPRRALQVAFSRPLATTGVSLATNAGKMRNVTELDDLDDERVIIAVVTETLALSVAQTFFPNADIRVYDSAEKAEADLLGNRAHAYLATEPEINFLVLQNPGKVNTPIAESLMASAEGLAVRRGEQDLLNFLNAWVTARRTDKWLPAARNYWFSTLDWTSQLKE